MTFSSFNSSLTNDELIHLSLLLESDLIFCDSLISTSSEEDVSYLLDRKSIVNSILSKIYESTDFD